MLQGALPAIWNLYRSISASAVVDIVDHFGTNDRFKYNLQTFYNDLLSSRVSLNETDDIYSNINRQHGPEPNDTISTVAKIVWYLFWLSEPVLNQKHNPYRQSNFNLYSMRPSNPRSTVINDKYPEFLDYLYNSIFTHGNLHASAHLRKHYNLVLNLFLPTHSHFPGNFNYTRDPNQTELQRLIEIEVVACGKTVYISNKDSIEAEFAFLSKNYPWHQFYRRKEILPMASHGTAFQYTGNSKLPIFYKSLVETGLHHRIEQELVARHNLHRKPAAPEFQKKFRDKEEGDAVGLNGSFSTFFIVWGAAVTISVPALVFEIRHRILPGINIFFTSAYLTCRRSLNHIFFKFR